MSQIDVPAEEDTGGISRLIDIDDPRDESSNNGSFVVVPASNEELDAANRWSDAVHEVDESGAHHALVEPSSPATSDPSTNALVTSDPSIEKPLTNKPPRNDPSTATEPEARQTPLRPYIEDPSAPMPMPGSPGVVDPRVPWSGTQQVEVTTVVASQPNAPMIRPGIRLRRSPRPRVRRVKRIIRSIDTWTVFKVSVIFYLAMYVIFLVAAVLLWRVANATGTLDNIQNFLTHYGWTSFKFRGGEIFHSTWIIGLFLVVAGVGLNVAMATLFNLIADLVGGIRVTVLEEEVRLRPRVQITKAVVPQPAPVAPTPGEPLLTPSGPPMVSPQDPSGPLPQDLTSEIMWIAPSSEVTTATEVAAEPSESS